MDSLKENSFSRLISEYQQSRGLVGLGAIVLKGGLIQGIAVSGERVVNSGNLLDANDKWHIGSITKSVTSTLIGRLVERKQLHWDTSIGEIFDSTVLIHDGWMNVTIVDLLTHTSGAPANFPLRVLFQKAEEGIDRVVARRKAVLKLLKKQPLYSCGSQHIYSNVGYTIAGALVEELSGYSWEDLVRAEIFEPLGLLSAGFGPPQDIVRPFEQPRGHRKRLFRSQRVQVGTQADNTPIIGPAGIIHMSLTDLANFANEHLYGDLGEGKLLSSESYKLLHTSVLDNYACGWVINPGNTVWHNGSNTMWYAFVAYEPRSKRVIALAANDPDITECESVATMILEETKTIFE